MKIIISGNSHNNDYELFKTNTLKRIFHLYVSGNKRYTNLFNVIDAANNIFEFNGDMIEIICSEQDSLYDMSVRFANDFDIKLNCRIPDMNRCNSKDIVLIMLDGKDNQYAESMLRFANKYKIKVITK